MRRRKTTVFGLTPPLGEDLQSPDNSRQRLANQTCDALVRCNFTHSSTIGPSAAGIGNAAS